MITSTKLKLVIIDQMDPLGERIGGIATYLRGMIKHSPDNYEFYWIGIASADRKIRLREWNDIKIERRFLKFFPVFNIKNENKKSFVPLSLKFVLALFLLRRKLALEDAVLVFSRPESLLPFKGMSNKKILSIHGNMVDAVCNPKTEVKWKYLPWLFFRLEKYLIHNPYKIFVVHQGAVERYRKNFPDIADRFQFMPTWYDQDIFYPKKELFKEAKAKNIVFVGRLESVKDPHLLLKTFDWIVKKEENLPLSIIGEGKLEDEIKGELEKRGLKESSNLYGPLRQIEIAEILRESALFLMTSAYEGMPRVVVESLACGTPVVTTDVGEVRRVVRNGISGEIVMERTPEALGEAVLGILRNPQKYSVQNCVESVKDYSAPKVLEKIYTAFNE